MGKLPVYGRQNQQPQYCLPEINAQKQRVDYDYILLSQLIIVEFYTCRMLTALYDFQYQQYHS